MTSAVGKPVHNLRASQRYPFRAEARFQIISRRNPTAGIGRTVDLSSVGVLIETAEPLPKGARIKVSIAWPARLNDRIGLSLEVVGRIARTDGLLAGVAFDRYEFRTRGLRSEIGQEAPGR